jgi:transcriptional regulator with XRE-family HTH domain
MNQTTLIQTLNSAVLDAERQGQTKYRTAKRAGLNPGALSRFMARKGKPTIATIQAVAQAFGKRVEFQLADDEDAIDELEM